MTGHCPGLLQVVPKTVASVFTKGPLSSVLVLCLVADIGYAVCSDEVEESVTTEVRYSPHCLGLHKPCVLSRLDFLL